VSALEVKTLQSPNNFNLTLDAQGSGSDIIIQSNGSQVASITDAGLLTATTFAGSGASLTGIPAAQLTGSLPAISGASLTALPAAQLTGSLPAISGASLTNINTPSFLVQASTNQTIANATNVVGAYATEHWDTDSAWDNSLHKFTVPAGKGGGYHFTVAGYMTNIDDGENFRMSLAKNGTILSTSETKWFSSASNQEMMMARSWDVKLAAADYVQIFIYHTEGASQVLDYRFSTFSGFKIAGA
jgi:hypothetical protein